MTIHFSSLCQPDYEKGELTEPLPPSNTIKRESMRWERVLGNTEIFPEHSETARNIIKNWMGFRPQEVILQNHEGFVRALYDNFHIKKIISSEQFKKEMTDIIRLMRNTEMKSFGWVSRGVYGDHVWELYQTENIIYKERARDRLAAVMNEEPDLRFSVEAELLIRMAFAHDTFIESNLNEGDIKAATITKYRELYFTKGMEAADNMPLYAEMQDWLK